MTAVKKASKIKRIKHKGVEAVVVIPNEAKQAPCPRCKKTETTPPGRLCAPYRLLSIEERSMVALSKTWVEEFTNKFILLSSQDRTTILEKLTSEHIRLKQGMQK